MQGGHVPSAATMRGIKQISIAITAEQEWTGRLNMIDEKDRVFPLDSSFPTRLVFRAQDVYGNERDVAYIRVDTQVLIHASFESCHSGIDINQKAKLDFDKGADQDERVHKRISDLHRYRVHFRDYDIEPSPPMVTKNRFQGARFGAPMKLDKSIKLTTVYIKNEDRQRHNSSRKNDRRIYPSSCREPCSRKDQEAHDHSRQGKEEQ